jgi:hypothetical protein
MYKCLDCGNVHKFYGIVKEEGKAIIFQNENNEKDGSRPAAIKPVHAVTKTADSREELFDDKTVRGNLWAISENCNKDGITWAYLLSDSDWKGFHEIISCAVCNSTNIVWVDP